MVEVIDGKRYNIETAKALGEWEVYSDYYDLETLYIKNDGEFFLHLQAWPPDDDVFGGKEFPNIVTDWIRPLTTADAKKWAEKCLDGDKYEEIFGEVEE